MGGSRRRPGWGLARQDVKIDGDGPIPRSMSPSPTTSLRLAPRASVWVYVGFVSLLGAAAVALAIRDLSRQPFSPWIILLALVTIVSGRFRIKVPGHPASVSVSEVFVFASILRFGPGPATLTVAIDGLLISLTQKDRRLYRALFNIAEPAISTSLAA